MRIIVISSGKFDFKTTAWDNNAQQMPMGDLGPNIPKGICDGALQFKGRKVS